MTGRSENIPLLPRHLAEKALAQRGNIEGERKLVTIMFADLVGSTALASRMDPEDMVELLNGLFTRWVDAVHRFEGTVDKFLGDGILALFGAPLVHEDDPRRAVLAALQIRAATAEYASTLPDTHLDVRIGINTGTVVVGTVGSDARMEYTAIGDAVNVAQRVEASARPGSVYLSQSTHDLVAPYFSTSNAGEFALKGKPEPVPLYEVVGDLGVTTTVRGVAGLTSPIVGRDSEIERLRTALDDLRGGTGSVLAMVGEPGLGKSRLLAETRLLAADLAWAEGHALSYGSSTPYLPLAQIVSAITPRPDDSDLRALVTGTEAGPVDGRRERIITSMREAIVGAAPLVIALEDLHWVDESSRDVLEAMAPVAETEPVLFLMTSRPEGRRAAERMGAQVIEIEPLAPEAGFDLVRNLLHLERIPESLRDLILDKAQGNPFFVEEFLRMLIGDGVLTQEAGEWTADSTPGDLAIPPTLESLLASRIDRLAPGPKRVLQAASVLGRQFHEQVLAELVDPADALVVLRSEGFMVGGSGERAHAFKHVITQEVAYESALKRTRRVWHLAAGDAIERIYAGQVGARAAELGRHFDLGGDTRRAVEHLSVAARNAADSYA
ncbi:MAG: AAA family ATPase, partial [Acidimicrobiia bacterium]|nr:AAA family ATPase [Acidimicrobiia bacterium]